MTSIQKSDCRDRCAPKHGPEREFFKYYDQVHILGLQLASGDEILGLPTHVMVQRSSIRASLTYYSLDLGLGQQDDGFWRD